jgi:hypothetical protein
VTPLNLIDINCYFGETWCLHLQSGCAAKFKSVDVIYDLEDGGDTFIRNVYHTTRRLISEVCNHDNSENLRAHVEIQMMRKKTHTEMVACCVL